MGINAEGMNLHSTFLRAMNELKNHERYNEINDMVRDAYINEWVRPDEEEEKMMMTIMWGVMLALHRLAC